MNNVETEEQVGFLLGDVIRRRILPIRPTEVLQPFSYFISHSAKDGEPCPFITRRRSRIFKAPVETFCLTRKDWTLLIRVITNSNHIIELLSQEFIDGFRALVGNIYVQFVHYLDRLRSYLTGRDAGTGDFKIVTSNVSQDSFRHLAACR